MADDLNLDDINLDDIDLEGVPVTPAKPQPTEEELELTRGIFDDEEDPAENDSQDLEDPIEAHETTAVAVDSDDNLDLAPAEQPMAEVIPEGKEHNRDPETSTREAEASENAADPDDDLDLDDLLGDTPPTIPELFPTWRDLFARRPFAQVRTSGEGSRVLLLGFAYQEGQDGSLKLDNCRVGDVMFRDLVSICAPFSRSNETDSKGVKVKVIEAVEGLKLKCWTNLRENGTRRDSHNTTFVVTEEGLKPAS